MALNFTNNSVGVLALFKQTGSVHFRLWTQERNIQVWDAYPGLIPTIQVPVWLKLSGTPALNQSISLADQIFDSGFAHKLGHFININLKPVKL